MRHDEHRRTTTRNCITSNFRFDANVSLEFYLFKTSKQLGTQGVSGGIVNILGGGNMDYSE